MSLLRHAVNTSSTLAARALSAYRGVLTPHPLSHAPLRDDTPTLPAATPSDVIIETSSVGVLTEVRLTGFELGEILWYKI